MTSCPQYSHLLVLPRLQIQNANAVSSPLTHGFPAITAFTGLMWALQRRLKRQGADDLRFKAVGVVCHQYQELVNDGFIKSFSLTRNPITKDGKTAAIVEEGRIHLDISLVFAVDAPQLGMDDAYDDELARHIGQQVAAMRVAGGSVVPGQRQVAPYWVAMTGDDKGKADNFRNMRLRLLPGFALVARDDLLDAELVQQRQKYADATVLDAWLARVRINHRYDAVESQWTHDRVKGAGWVVPIPVGYTALTDIRPAGSVPNTRDASTPFRFVEGLYSLGQWISPHRMDRPEQLLWYPDADADDGIYRCRNDFSRAEASKPMLDANDLY